MELQTKDGMTLVSVDDLEHLRSLKHLFKNFRDTVAFAHIQSKEGKPIVNLTSKMWRISDKILDKLKKLDKKGG